MILENLRNCADMPQFPVVLGENWRKQEDTLFIFTLDLIFLTNVNVSRIFMWPKNQKKNSKTID